MGEYKLFNLENAQTDTLHTKGKYPIPVITMIFFVSGGRESSKRSNWWKHMHVKKPPQKIHKISSLAANTHNATKNRLLQIAQITMEMF